MEVITTIIFWSCLTIILYVYIGYPLLLTILLPFKRKKSSKADIIPMVTLIISAYNEEGVIAGKIENSLALDYPKDKFEIMVISDCSTDNTDEIVKKFSSWGVKWVRQNERLGKTSGLNLGVSQAQGRIIVFSDANAYYEPDAIKKLVRNFHNPAVGYVTGEARYKKKWQSSSEKSESLYWKYEIFLKNTESKMASMVGGDGAIYAIRKELFEPLQPTDINDFVNPLQIIAKGFRGFYEPEAICYEETAESLRQEFHRKKRIVNRSWNGLFRVRNVLNPFRVGFFAVEIISHKLLRWMIPFFLTGLFVSNVLMLAFHITGFFEFFLFAQISFYAFAFIGYLKSAKTSILFYLPYYFCLVNTASLLGIFDYYQGHVETTWEPVRTDSCSTRRQSKAGLIWATATGVTLFILAGLSVVFHLKPYLPVFLFWSTLSLIVYTYIGYPLLLASITLFKKKPVQKGDYQPSVSLVIPAYNEAKDIGAKIENSLALNYPKEKMRIIVGSDGSTDGTNEIVSRYADQSVELQAYPRRRGKISVINDILQNLTSDIVIFSDANAFYHENVITNLVRNFYDPSVGAVSGDIRFVRNKTTLNEPDKLYYRYERFIQRKETEFHSMVGADGAIFAIRKELFTPLSKDTILDDLIIPMQIANSGWRVVYEEEAHAIEAAPATVKEEFHRKIRLLAGAVQALKIGVGRPSRKNKPLFFSFVSHKSIRWLVPLLAVTMYWSTMFLLASAVYAVFFWLQTCLILLALLGAKWNHRIFTVPYYLVLNNFAMLLGLVKGVLGRQSVIWKKFDRTHLTADDILTTGTAKNQA